MKGILAIGAAMLMFACHDKTKDGLPILGPRELDGTDTIYHTIAKFDFVDQDGLAVTNETFKGRIYVADFFFTTCRTICPIMKTQMLRVYRATEDMSDFMIISHTIDPEYDTVELLKSFADRLGVEGDRWRFVTGERDSIYKIAQTSYFASAVKDPRQPDGFIHSGSFLLIDRLGRIRGRYDGTDAVEVDELMKDIRRLNDEQQ